MPLNELEKIMPALNDAGEPRRWKDIEKSLAIELPSDYKKFIDKYGTGWVGDFLLVLDPGSATERYNLIKSSAEILSNYQSSKESFPQFYSHTIFDGKNGIFPCAITDNADVIYWQYEDGEPKNIVVYNARGGDYFSVKSTLSDFIHDVLVKTIVCDLFPEDFPAENIEFVIDEG
jgi:SMI1-KNR4 cell-wall